MENREALRARAIELREQGLSTTQIARELGIRRSSTLSGWLAGTPPPEWTRRPRAKDAERERARAMRRDGRSYSEIAAALGVSKSSISLWVRDLPRPVSERTSDEARRAGAARYFAKRRRATFIERENEKLSWASELGPLSERELLMAGAVAYWAEGTKSKPHRPQERLVFVNSDPDLIRLFLAWLDLVGVEDERRRYQLQIHASADVAAAERFWAEVVGVSVTSFQPSTLKRHNPRTNRHNTGDRYHGCLSIRILGSASLYRRVEGIWWAVASSAGRRLRSGPGDSRSIHSLPGEGLQRFRRMLSRVV